MSPLVRAGGRRWRRPTGPTPAWKRSSRDVADSPAARSASVVNSGPGRPITRSSRTARTGRSIRFHSNRFLRNVSDKRSTANDRSSEHVARNAAPPTLRARHRMAAIPKRTESRTEARYQRGRRPSGFPLPCRPSPGSDASCTSPNSRDCITAHPAPRASTNTVLSENAWTTAQAAEWRISLVHKFRISKKLYFCIPDCPRCISAGRHFYR